MALSVSVPMAIPSSPIHHLNAKYDFNGFFRPKIPCKFCNLSLPLQLRHSIIRKQLTCRGASEPLINTSLVAEDRGVWVTESGQFSVTDSQLNSHGFELHRSFDNLDLEQLNTLFVKVGFPRREKDKLLRALHNTPSLLWLEYKKSGKVVAFARATGDDVFNAIIWDVVVDPSFQGCGLGKAVMERLMADLLAKGITNIALYAEPHVLGFYRPLGFTADPDGIKAMVYSTKNRRRR